MLKRCGTRGREQVAGFHSCRRIAGDLLLVYRFVCSVESQSRERSVSPAARTERGPDRPGPLATRISAVPRAERAGTGGSAPPRPYRRPRARSRPLRSYEYEHRDATAQLLPFYKHSNFASARNGRCERRRLRGALLWAPPRITPRIPLVACGTEALAGRLTHLQGPNTPHHASSSSSRSIALLLPR